VCFPNAPPPLSSLHNKEDGIKFGLWENKGLTRTKKMMVAETDKMLYLGQPVVRNPAKCVALPCSRVRRVTSFMSFSSGRRYYIMAVDKTSNKAKLVPVSNFYHMQQQIKGYTPQLPTDVRLLPSFFSHLPFLPLPPFCVTQTAEQNCLTKMLTGGRR
jgi:hypothetical protein